MILSGQLFLFYFAILIGVKDAQTIRKILNFKRFWSIWSVFSRFCVRHGAEQVKNGKGMSYSCVPNGFYFSLRSRSGGNSAQTYEECLNLSIFCRLGTFLEFFGQVKEWLRLELYGIIGMSHKVA